MSISPLAGKPLPTSELVDVTKLIAAYYDLSPDFAVPDQRISFGTSGHRGSSFHHSFNEAHILAVSQAICLYRSEKKIDGPLFLGMDTHALSLPALKTTLEVLAANQVLVMLAERDEYTPTPVISHAILNYNRNRQHGVADGIVITPSHNPPQDCGIKYNPPHGGPAEIEVTQWIEKKANSLLESSLAGIKRISYEKALQVSTTRRFDYIQYYVADLTNIIDMALIRDSKVPFGIDPLGGAGTHYWQPIIDRYGLNGHLVSQVIDPTFSFMPVDSDGQIRMDPSSKYAMRRLIDIKERFPVAFACDTDYDRHGVVARSVGLLPANSFLATAAHYLLQHRTQWASHVGIGKTAVTTRMLDAIAAKFHRKLDEMPVGFKWFVDGLYQGVLGFCGEESAGASFLRKDGQVWTTDKDGMIMGLLAVEMTARLGKDPGEIYRDLTQEFGTPYFGRVEATASTKQKESLKHLSAEQVQVTEIAGEKIQKILTHAPGNGASLGGLKVEMRSGWFAARPSGTEEMYRIYAESFKGEDHLARLLEEAQRVVDSALH